MGGRILRIELRRSVALLAGLLIAAVGVFILFASNPPYWSWMALVTFQRDIMQMTWPLALGAGAWQGIRERRSRVEELFATTPRPRRLRVLPVATAMATAAVAAYLVMFAVATGHLRQLGGYLPLNALPIIALGALGMVVAVWLSLAIGALLPSPLTPPILVVIGFVLVALVPNMLFDQDRRPGIMLLFPNLQGPRDGAVAVQMLSGRANLAQAVWLAALAVTGLAVFAAARPGTRVAALVPVLLGIAIAVPAMPRQIAAAWVEDHRATEVVCTRDVPKVCITRAYSYLSDPMRSPAGVVMAALAAKVPPSPTRVLVVDVGKNPPPEGAQPVDTLIVYIPFLEELRAGEPAPDALLWTMAEGAGIRPCGDLTGLDPSQPSVARYLAARVAVGAWLLDRDVPQAAQPDDEPLIALARQALAVLRALPADEQRTRVGALRDAERTCADGDRWELLTGVGGPR